MRAGGRRDAPWVAWTVLALTWLLTRVILVVLLHGSQAWVAGDVGYFAASLEALPSTGLAGILVEYPVPAVLVVGLPALVAEALGGNGAYTDAFVALALLADLGFALALALAGRRDRLGPLAVWVAAVPALGTTTLVRFDLLPGVLCGVALLALPRHRTVAALLAALATGIKLWPALILPAVLGATRSPRRSVVTVLLTGSVLVLGSLAAAGWGRLLSPLTYQDQRGLQIESVAATPAMVGWVLAPPRWEVGYAASRSFEITGPLVPGLLAASTLATLVFVAGLLAACWRVAGRSRAGIGVEESVAVWLALAAVGGFVLVGKVFSPQYLLWLLPLAAAGLVVADSRALRRWVGLLLVAAALTQLVFPLGYAALTAGTGAPGPVVAVLALRNLLVTGLVLYAAGATWRGLAGGQPGRELARQPPGPERT